MQLLSREQQTHGIIFKGYTCSRYCNLHKSLYYNENLERKLRIFSDVHVTWAVTSQFM